MIAATSVISLVSDTEAPAGLESPQIYIRTKSCKCDGNAMQVRSQRREAEPSSCTEDGAARAKDDRLVRSGEKTAETHGVSYSVVAGKLCPLPR